MHQFDLKNRTAIITGGAQGFGLDIARKFLNSGANVIIWDVDEKELQSAVKEINNPKLSSNLVDVSNFEIVNKTVIEISKVSNIDILVNNNGGPPPSTFDQLADEDWQNAFNDTMMSAIRLSKLVLPDMKKNQWGRIINISSIYGLVGADQRIYGKSKLNSPISYAVTKGGIINLTRYLAAYWHRKNIRVNTLSLGGVLDKSYMKKDFIKKYSEKTMLGRMANEEEYKGALLFLASDASSYMTGANLVMDGGWTAW